LSNHSETPAIERMNLLSGRVPTMIDFLKGSAGSRGRTAKFLRSCRSSPCSVLQNAISNKDEELKADASSSLPRLSSSASSNPAINASLQNNADEQAAQINRCASVLCKIDLEINPSMNFEGRTTKSTANDSKRAKSNEWK
jgi:hypothetical protein